jgi:hypothetical protein
MAPVQLLMSMLLIPVCFGANFSDTNSTNELENVKRLIPIRHCERCTQDGHTVYRYLLWGSERQGEVTVCLGPGQVLRHGAIVTAFASQPKDCPRFRTNYHVTDFILAAKTDIATDCQQFLDLIFQYVDLYFEKKNWTSQQFTENFKWVCDPDGHLVKFVFSLTQRNNTFSQEHEEGGQVYDILIQSFAISGKNFQLA